MGQLKRHRRESKFVEASLLEFARTGQFGPLRCGTSREELLAALGAPPLWGTEQDREIASIWRYGNVEFYFDEDRVWMIFSDHEDLSDGGETLRVNRWIVRRGLPRLDFETQLTKEAIEFNVVAPSYDPHQRLVRTSVGAVFGFIDYLEDEFDELGMFGWWASSKSVRY